MIDSIDKLVRVAHNGAVDVVDARPMPSRCPACAGELVVTRLQCPACGTEVTGAFDRGRLINLPEPHASLLELFLRVRGNVKDVERQLGLSYPTVRARLEEAFTAARPKLEPPAADAAAGARGSSAPAADAAAQRAAILDQLERDEISAQEAAARLRDVQAHQAPQSPPQRRTT